jgi:hypothetical protein
MTSIQAAFDILCLLSLSDGANDEELRVIQEFLDANHVAGEEIHAAHELEALMAMSGDEVMTRYRDAVAAFKANAPQPQWRPLVEFAVKVAVADRNTSNIEVVGVGYLASQLDVVPVWQ